MPDSFRKLFGDTARDAAAAAARAAAAVRPHVTLDNAIKIATAAETALRALETARRIAQPAPPAPRKKGT